MQIIDRTALNDLSIKAQATPRRRLNHNYHTATDAPCQRLLNAVEPGSYVRPHRHLDPPKTETFIALQGEFAVIIFTDSGEIKDVVRLNPQSDTFGVDLPAGIWHTVVSLQPGSVFFETKPGPYDPISDKDWAPWAPVEGEAGALAYLENLTKSI